MAVIAGRAPAAMMASLFGWESAAKLAIAAAACSCCSGSVQMSCSRNAARVSAIKGVQILL